MARWPCVATPTTLRSRWDSPGKGVGTLPALRGARHYGQECRNRNTPQPWRRIGVKDRGSLMQILLPGAAGCAVRCGAVRMTMCQPRKNLVTTKIHGPKRKEILQMHFLS